MPGGRLDAVMLGRSDAVRRSCADRRPICRIDIVLGSMVADDYADVPERDLDSGRACSACGRSPLLQSQTTYSDALWSQLSARRLLAIGDNPSSLKPGDITMPWMRPALRRSRCVWWCWPWWLSRPRWLATPTLPCLLRQRDSHAAHELTFSAVADLLSRGAGTGVAIRRTTGTTQEASPKIQPIGLVDAAQGEDRFVKAKLRRGA